MGPGDCLVSHARSIGFRRSVVADRLRFLPAQLEETMFRLATFVALQIALLSVALEPTWAAEYGTADEAKAMLERAIAAVKEDKAKALDMFSKGEGGFKDRDL